MIEQNIAASSQADLELATRIIAAVDGCQPAVEYREAAISFIEQAIAGPPELHVAAESIVAGLADDAATAVLLESPGLPIDHRRLAAYIVRQVGAIAAFGENGGVIFDPDR